MRTLQEVFDVVIDNGFYCPVGVNGTDFGVNFMCGSLEIAYQRGVIDETELIVAKRHINYFLSSLGTRMFLISAVLNTRNLSYSTSNVEDDRIAGNKCLEIYRNWDKRHKIISEGEDE